MKDNLQGFNASQREAICHKDGPALVLAGPGSGKTTVITKRLQYLTEGLHIPPEEITVVTFTKAAAEEMQQRFQALLETELPVRFGTFHAIYYRILRENSQNGSLTLLKEKEKNDLIRHILRGERIDPALAPAFLEAVRKIKGGGVLPEENALIADAAPEQVERVFQKYRQICREKKKLDFDDMAYECLQLLQERPDVLKLWQGRCRYILADEYQDIAPIQEKILSMLALPENNLFLVGDDDQSIYGFRGAGTEIMLSFPKKYPDTKQIFLELNYRCRPGIIRAADAVISENKSRFVKKQTAAKEASGEEEVICRGFPDQEAENREIVRLLRDIRRAGGLSGAALLYRKHADAEALTALLNRYRIPFVRMEKAENLYEHFVTEDITAYLRFLYGDRTRKNFYRIMNRPQRQIDREGCSSETISFQELLEHHVYDTDVIKKIRKLEQDCRRASRMSLYAALVYIRKGMGYEAYLKAEYRGEALEEAMQILQRLQELAGQAGNIKEWEQYIEEGKQKYEGKAKRKGSKEGVHILTYHSSKGLEFDHVIMPDLNEGSVPHKKAASEREIEEERRMFYVGMTRAREKLYLYYRTGSKEEPETVSRFLKALI